MMELWFSQSESALVMATKSDGKPAGACGHEDSTKNVIPSVLAKDLTSIVRGQILGSTSG